MGETHVVILGLLSLALTRIKSIESDSWYIQISTRTLSSYHCKFSEGIQAQMEEVSAPFKLCILWYLLEAINAEKPDEY